MKKILLIPTYHYLSNPLYTALYSLLKEEYKFTYFFSKDSTMVSGNIENITYDKIGYIFDEYIELNYDAPWVKRAKRQKPHKIDSGKKLNSEKNLEIDTPNENNLKSDYCIIKYIKKIYCIIKYIKKIYCIIKYIKKIYRWIKRFFIRWKNKWLLLYGIKKYIHTFRDSLLSASPDIIILTSDMTLSYRIVRYYFPKVQIMILQPCFLDFRKKEKKILSKSQKIRNLFLNNLLYPSQQYYGMENSLDKLLLIEERFLEFYKNKRDNVHKVINPYYYQLNKDVSKLQTTLIKQELLKKLNLDTNKKVIIIFISDYTLIHGEDVQTYLEETYTRVINTYTNKYNFIIKNHPRAGVVGYENNFSHLSNICFIQDEITYLELLSLGDLNISINSNASLEAIVGGMVTLNFLPLQLEHDEHYKWLTYYGGINVSTYEEMQKFLNTFNNNHYNLTKDLTNNRIKLLGRAGECKEQLLSIIEG